MTIVLIPIHIIILLNYQSIKFQYIVWHSREGSKEWSLYCTFMLELFNLCSMITSELNKTHEEEHFIKQVTHLYTGFQYKMFPPPLTTTTCPLARCRICDFSPVSLLHKSSGTSLTAEGPSFFSNCSVPAMW